MMAPLSSSAAAAAPCHPVFVLEKTLNLKTRKGNVATVVRERYCHSDIPCQSVLCPGSKCAAFPGWSARAHFDAPITHVLFPDFRVSVDYVEFLEQKEIGNVVLCETILQTVQDKEKARLYARMRDVVKDPSGKATVFCNENFIETFQRRGEGESWDDRNKRAIWAAACWYADHIQQRVPIVFLSSESGKHHPGLEVMNLPEYVARFWPDNNELANLVSSIETSLIEQAQLVEDASTHGKSGRIFEEHKEIDYMEAGVKSGIYFSGVLQVSASNSQNAYISGGKRLNRNIQIPRRTARNRAVHGDLVAVELLTEDQWVANADDDADGINNETKTKESIAKASNKARKPTGKVIGILKRNWRPYVCTLDLSSSKAGGDRFLAVPLDVRIPKIRIQTSHKDRYANDRILVSIDYWKSDDDTYPRGHLVRSLGARNQVDTEILSILFENKITLADFTKAMIDALPTNGPEDPWKVEPDQVKLRRDLRSTHTVVSIDPLGSEDIDDALSTQILPNGNIELGVHIADVTHFLPQNSLLDLEARSRGTTIYLADRRFNMLPAILSEDLCSLRGNEDRYAVSVIWTMNANFDVISRWYGRTIIRSAREMYYEQAQSLLDGTFVYPPDNRDKDFWAKIKQSVFLLTQIARKLRLERLSKGALELESTEVRFKFDNDKSVADIIPKKELEIHKVVAECMIFANAAVAEQIYSVFPDVSLLRKHPAPLADDLADLVKAASARNLEMDLSSNKTLAMSLARCGAESQDPEFEKMLRSMATRGMAEAEYFSTGTCAVNEFFHYGLALEFYTHFTSPIRRYADVIVHRLLMKSLEMPRTFDWSNEYMAEVASHLNRKNRESKKAQEDSMELFQSLYVLMKQENNEAILDAGVVVDIRAFALTLYVPRYGIRGRVYLKEKDGPVTIPAGIFRDAKALSTSTTASASDEESVAGEIFFDANEPGKIMLRSATGQCVTVRLGDRAQVKLIAQESRFHRHEIRLRVAYLIRSAAAEKGKGESKQLSLVSTARSQSDGNQPSASSSSSSSASAGKISGSQYLAMLRESGNGSGSDAESAVLDGGGGDVMAAVSQLRKRVDESAELASFRQTAERASMYRLIEQFEAISLHRN